jgi:hypothetical protein
MASMPSLPALRSISIAQLEQGRTQCFRGNLSEMRGLYHAALSSEQFVSNSCLASRLRDKRTLIIEILDDFVPVLLAALSDPNRAD